MTDSNPPWNERTEKKKSWICPHAPAFVTYSYIPCVRSLEWPHSAFPVRRTTEQKKINVKRERSLYALYATVEVSEFSYFVCFVESICFSAVTKTWPKRLFRKWLKNLRGTRPKIQVPLKTTLKMTRKMELTTRNTLVRIAIKPLHENTTWKSIHENIPETNLTNVAFVANNLFKVRSGDRFFIILAMKNVFRCIKKCKTSFCCEIDWNHFFYLRSWLVGRAYEVPYRRDGKKLQDCGMILNLF